MKLVTLLSILFGCAISMTPTNYAEFSSGVGIGGGVQYATYANSSVCLNDLANVGNNFFMVYYLY